MHWGAIEEDAQGYPVPHEAARRIPGGFAWSSLPRHACDHGGGPTVEPQTDADFLANGPRLDLGMAAFRAMIVAAGGNPLVPPAWLGELELIDATAAGDLARMELLLHGGVAVDAARFGRSAITAALHGKRLELVSWLLARGARPSRWSEGATREVVHWLFRRPRSLQGWERVFEELVVAGIDLRGRAGGDAVLFAEDPRIVARLLTLGATPSPRYASGSTALHCACARGPWHHTVGGDASAIDASTKLVALLVAAGAELDAVARDGHTAVRGAVESGHVAALRLLLDAGAAHSLAPMPAYLKQFGKPFATPVERARELARDPVKAPLAAEMVRMLDEASRR